MWDLPGPGLKPMPPALAGRFLSTAPAGKPQGFLFFYGSTICSFFFYLDCLPFSIYCHYFTAGLYKNFSCPEYCNILPTGFPFPNPSLSSNFSILLSFSSRNLIMWILVQNLFMVLSACRSLDTLLLMICLSYIWKSFPLASSIHNCSSMY